MLRKNPTASLIAMKVPMIVSAIGRAALMYVPTDVPTALNPWVIAVVRLVVTVSDMIVSFLCAGFPYFFAPIPKRPKALKIPKLNRSYVIQTPNQIKNNVKNVFAYSL